MRIRRGVGSGGPGAAMIVPSLISTCRQLRTGAPGLAADLDVFPTLRQRQYKLSYGLGELVPGSYTEELWDIPRNDYSGMLMAIVAVILHPLSFATMAIARLCDRLMPTRVLFLSAVSILALL